ncbi:MAG: non-canonical purine NTP diphosphatase [Bacteroidales bacterium]|nr:non-canonical purine NTP diphosphatase [Bacteroidales bacterium]
MRKFVFATNNLHKLREIQALLSDDFEILSLNDIGCTDDIPEEYYTLEDNACAKARFIFKKFGIDCFADDTGLEVEALDGDPGVFSARYAGENKDPVKNMEKLLLNMEGALNRKAQFKTVIALVENGMVKTFEGIVKGEIVNHPRGMDGFGYDPVFKPEGYSKTFAEMPLHEKNLISHRARAFQLLVAYLNRK